MSRKPQISVKRAFGRQSVRVAATFKANGYRNDDLTVNAACEISTIEARELATALVAESDRVDAVAEKKAAAEARRKEWREREIAAGRMARMSISDVFGRRSS